LEGLVLRPLSANLLPPTVPEEMGIVDREKLLNISGRSRKPQMALARDYKIGNYPCPAGGCLLTDPGFSRRMKDLMAHSEITLNDIELLKVGRHFRLSHSCKIIIGRNKEENERILKLSKVGDLCFEPKEVMGPIGIGRGDFDQIAIFLACQIMARYSDGNNKVGIIYQRLPDGEKSLLRAKPMQNPELQNFRI